MTFEQLNEQILSGKTRYCKKCNKSLPVSDFYIKQDKNKNHFRFNSPCKRCSNANRRTDYQRIYQIKAKYNISFEEYSEMLKSQNNACSICNINIEQYGKNFAVDHCHITNRVRGLLCQRCNIGIGMLQEDTSVLEKAISYLKKHSIGQLDNLRQQTQNSAAL